MSSVQRGLPKFLTLVGIVCAFLAFILPLVAFVTPQAGSQTLGLLVVKPTPASIENVYVDGPSLFAGPLASCTKDKDGADMDCTGQSINPTYDTSKLPDNSLKVVLTSPSPVIGGIVATSLAITMVFSIVYTLVAMRTVFGIGPDVFNGPGMQIACAWLSSVGFMTGFVGFLIMLMWFTKSITDINHFIASQGAAGPRLVAELGHSWFFVAGGYAAYLVPWAVAAMKMNQDYAGKTVMV